jgi:Zn-dependent oligopeptidase
MLETQIYSKFKKAKYKNWNKVGKEFSKNFLEKGSKGKAFEHYIKFAKKMPDSTFLLKQYKII